MAMLLKIDGTMEDMGFYPDSSKIHKAIGGYLEMVRFPVPFVHPYGTYRYMYVNEDGHRLKLPVNMTASDLARQEILGNVVLMDANDMKEDMGP